MAKEVKSESPGYALLIAAVVAIVAIVGLVILFKGGSDGMLVAMQSDWGPNHGLGVNMMRGYKGAFEPPNCGQEGIGTNDFNTNTEACYGQVGFPRNTLYYYDPNKGYRIAEGGMAIEGPDYEGYTEDSFYRGAYGKTVREDIQRTTLPATSREGIELG